MAAADETRAITWNLSPSGGWAQDTATSGSKVEAIDGIYGRSISGRERASRGNMELWFAAATRPFVSCGNSQKNWTAKSFVHNSFPEDDVRRWGEERTRAIQAESERTTDRHFFFGIDSIYLRKCGKYFTTHTFPQHLKILLLVVYIDSDVSDKMCRRNDRSKNYSLPTSMRVWIAPLPPPVMPFLRLAIPNQPLRAKGMSPHQLVMNWTQLSEWMNCVWAWGIVSRKDRQS